MSLIYQNLKDNPLLSLIMHMHHLIFKYITKQTFIFNLDNLYIIFLKIEYNLIYKAKNSINILFQTKFKGPMIFFHYGVLYDKN